MTTGFGTRTNELREVVLNYFQSFPDDLAVVRQIGNYRNRVEIDLKKDLAHRFESIALPVSGHPGVRRLRLLFDRDLAAVAPGYEFVASGSHLLRIISNDLARNSSFTRSAVIYNLDFDFSDLRSVGVRIDFVEPRAECEFRPRRFVLLRYVFRLSSDEKTEDIIPILVDSDYLKVLPHSELAKISEYPFVNIDQVTYAKQVSVAPLGAAEFDSILRFANGKVKEIVELAVQERAKEAQSRLKGEKEEFERYHGKMIAEAKTHAQKQQLEQDRELKLQELTNRFALNAEMALLSVQEIIAPSLKYKLLVQANGAKQELQQEFLYDPLIGEVETNFCDQCGQKLHWAYCTIGHHIECGQCGIVEKCSDEKCQVAMCPEHRISCATCHNAICEQHVKKCSYCNSSVRYCYQHILRSFEEKDICPTCANSCGKCGSMFPQDAGERCVVCDGFFCNQHYSRCPSCGNPFCADHGAQADGHSEVFCQRCVTTCKDCSEDKRYLRSDLYFCSECGQSLCPSHQITCVSCGRILCSNDALDTPTGKGCSECFARCSTCGSMHHRSDLGSCRHCPPGDAGLHCKDHYEICSVCWDHVCEKHQITLHNGQEACYTCAEVCGHCGKYFDKAEVVTCSTCGGAFCREHSAVCEICGKPHCINHLIAIKDGRRACADCSNQCLHCKEYFERSVLAECHICNGLFCPDHSSICLVGLEPTCINHLRSIVDGDQYAHNLRRRVSSVERSALGSISGPQLYGTVDPVAGLLRARMAAGYRITDLPKGRQACERCSKQCSACNQYYSAGTTTTCASCNKVLCREHAIASQFKEEHYCSQHAASFANCFGCGRHGPGDQLNQCRICDVLYCQHCLGQDKECHYCRNAKDVNQVPGALEWLRIARDGLRGKAPAKCQSELEAALRRSDTWFELKFSESQTHAIVFGERSGIGGFFVGLFRNVRKFVVVVEKASRLVIRVKVNV